MKKGKNINLKIKKISIYFSDVVHYTWTAQYQSQHCVKGSQRLDIIPGDRGRKGHFEVANLYSFKTPQKLAQATVPGPLQTYNTSHSQYISMFKNFSFLICPSLQTLSKSIISYRSRFHFNKIISTSMCKYVLNSLLLQQKWPAPTSMSTFPSPF